MEFSAVLLAGGNSTRMGQDKAAMVIDGLPLWRRQIGVLHETGAKEVFIAGGQRTFDKVETLEDDVPDAGPLTGLIVSLRRARFPLLLVLAVDLPAMTSDYLQKLVSLARPGVGVMPRRGEFFEPLAAVYPREALGLAEQCRAEGQRALQVLVRRLVDSALVRPCDVSTEGEQHFLNVNTPKDWEALKKNPGGDGSSFR